METDVSAKTTEADTVSDGCYVRITQLEAVQGRLRLAFSDVEEFFGAGGPPVFTTEMKKSLGI